MAGANRHAADIDEGVDLALQAARWFARFEYQYGRLDALLASAPGCRAPVACQRGNACRPTPNSGLADRRDVAGRADWQRLSRTAMSLATTASRCLRRSTVPALAMLMLCSGEMARAQDLALRAADMAGSEYRLLSSRGRTDIVISLQAQGYAPPISDGANTGLPSAVPSVSLGLRYRMTGRHLLFADATGAQGVGANLAADQVSAKVGVEWTPSKMTMGFDQGALGMQLASGYRLSLKARHGGPALYLRTRF